MNLSAAEHTDERGFLIGLIGKARSQFPLGRFLDRLSRPIRRRDNRCSPPRPETFYGGGAEGYTDYPVFEWVG